MTSINLDEKDGEILTKKQKINLCLLGIMGGVERANSKLELIEQRIKTKDTLGGTNPTITKQMDEFIKQDVEAIKEFLKDLDKFEAKIKEILKLDDEGENN